MRAVKIPMGTSVMSMVREMLSTSNRKAAPKHMVAGSKFLWSGPTSIRLMWGMTSPTHPIIPLMDTAAAVIRVQQHMIMNLSFPVSSPRDWASSSPMARIFSLHLKMNSMVIPRIMGIDAMNTSLLSTAEMLPIS